MAGKLFTLLPLRDGASSGRAHTKDFVPARAAAGSAPGDDDGVEESEREGGRDVAR